MNESGVGGARAGSPDGDRQAAVAINTRPADRPRTADVVACYDLGVAAYDQLWSPVILAAAAGVVPWLELAAHSFVLDVGAGTGVLASTLRSAAPSVFVLAVDASAEMLRLAKQRGVPAVQADAMKLPVASESIDAVVLAYVLFHLPDPIAAVTESARALRPGGRIGTVTWAAERTEQAQVVWNETLAGAGVPPLAARRVDAGLDSPEAMDRLLRAAGLAPQRVWSERLCRQWDPASFWALASGSGVNRQRLAVLDPDTRRAVLTNLRAKLDRLGPDDYRWQGEVVCAVATKPATTNM